MKKRKSVMILFVVCVAVHLVACTGGNSGEKRKVEKMEVLDSSEVTEKEKQEYIEKGITKVYKNDKVTEKIPEKLYKLSLKKEVYNLEYVVSKLLDDYENKKKKVTIENSIEGSTFVLKEGGDLYTWMEGMCGVAVGKLEEQVVESPGDRKEAIEVCNKIVKSLGYDVDLQPWVIHRVSESTKEEYYQLEYQFVTKGVKRVGDISYSIPGSKGENDFVSGDHITFKYNSQGITDFTMKNHGEVDKEMESYEKEDILSSDEAIASLEKYLVDFNRPMVKEWGWSSQYEVTKGEIQYLPFLEKKEVVLIPVWYFRLHGYDTENGTPLTDLHEMEAILDARTGYVYNFQGR